MTEEYLLLFGLGLDFRPHSETPSLVLQQNSHYDHNSIFQESLPSVGEDIDIAGLTTQTSPVTAGSPQSWK